MGECLHSLFSLPVYALESDCFLRALEDFSRFFFFFIIKVFSLLELLGEFVI